MFKYIFELGQNHELSIAELISILGKENFTENHDKIAIFEFKEEIDTSSLQNQLGGTIKIMKVIGEIPYPKENDEELTIYLSKTLENAFSDEYFDKTKIDFGISIFNLRNRKSINIKTLLKKFKLFLKNSLNTSSRFVNVGFENPKTATVYKAQLAKKGLDINIIGCSKNILIAKGLSIQNIDSYRLRDYEKPARDARIGMLPPKLAQIMINLAGDNVNKIFDPFCGTGTILYEGMLMGKKMLGSDINPDMIKASKINCDFIEQEFNTVPVEKIFQKDATKINEKDIEKGIDAIVTEGFLGPALSQTPRPEKIKSNYEEIQRLYLAWIKNIKGTVKNGGKIIFCLPDYSNKIESPLFDILGKTGLKLKEKYLYKRADQVVGRLICVTEK
jgi:tRNA G10  N-methylase Trm11